MGTIKRGILGGFTGKVGAVVGSSWKGIETMRALPISVLNPKTTKQVGNRTRFSRVAMFAAAMLTDIVKPLNDRFAQKMSGYNAFTSRNSECFSEAGAFVPSKLSLSSGKLGDTPIICFSINDIGDAVVSWSPYPIGAYQMSTDLVFIAIISSQGDVLFTFSGTATRDESLLHVYFTLGQLPAGSIAYLSFLRVDGTIVSNSTSSVLI